MVYRFEATLLLLEADKQNRVKYGGKGLPFLAFDMACSGKETLPPAFRIILCHEILRALILLPKDDLIHVMSVYNEGFADKAMTEDDGKCSALLSQVTEQAITEIKEKELNKYVGDAVDAVNKAVRRWMAGWN